MRVNKAQVLGITNISDSYCWCIFGMMPLEKIPNQDNMMKSKHANFCKTCGDGPYQSSTGKWHSDPNCADHDTQNNAKRGK